MNAITTLDPCIICHEGILETDDTVACSNQAISHIFHRACVDGWATVRPLGEQIYCFTCHEFSLPVQGSAQVLSCLPS